MCVCLLDQLPCWLPFRLVLQNLRTLVAKMVLDGMDLFHFIPLSVVLAFTEGLKVRKRDLWSSFLIHMSIIWIYVMSCVHRSD